MSAARTQGFPVGFVPTMGAFHPGHMSLVADRRLAVRRRGREHLREPLQFSSATDLARYPANLERDVAMAQAAGVASCSRLR